MRGERWVKKQRHRRSKTRNNRIRTSTWGCPTWGQHNKPAFQHAALQRRDSDHPSQRMLFGTHPLHTAPDGSEEAGWLGERRAQGLAGGRTWSPLGGRTEVGDGGSRGREGEGHNRGLWEAKLHPPPLSPEEGFQPGAPSLDHYTAWHFRPVVWM